MQCIPLKWDHINEKLSLSFGSGLGNISTMVNNDWYAYVFTQHHKHKFIWYMERRSVGWSQLWWQIHNNFDTKYTINECVVRNIQIFIGIIPFSTWYTHYSGQWSLKKWTLYFEGDNRINWNTINVPSLNDILY